ncbi:MAG TPA: hypothetical protein VN731_10195 [Rhodanobacter sp.]|nr:hypothetical protein [Rhodanobacter sp.]
MAGDWIKMRVGLTTSPKVMRLAECLVDNPAFIEWSALSYGIGGYPALSDEDARSERHAALRITRYVTVTALLRFWGYANEHAKDDFVSGILAQDIDEIVGIPGFAIALSRVGWAKFDPNGGMYLPNFKEHNTSADARSGGAERQKRYREKLKNSAQTQGVKGDENVDVTRDVTVTHREEKRREEKKEQKTAPEGDLLDGIPKQVAADFKQLRQRLRAPITKTAMRGLKREAEKAGITLTAALEMCCERGWRGFKSEWISRDVAQPQPAGGTSVAASRPMP